MPHYVRLVYASRATFASAREGSGVEREIARILMQSRRNNPRDNLVGALYYADGYFFQCLEGEVAAVDTVYSRIASDPRHQDVQVLMRQAISAPAFTGWAMKYGSIAGEVKALMARFGRREFNPYSFDEPVIAGMLDLLRSTPDVPVAAAEPAPVAPGASDARGRLSLALSVASLAVAVAALLVALLR
jgi:hypothetical protein